MVHWFSHPICGVSIFSKYPLLRERRCFWFSLIRFSLIRCSLLCVMSCQSAIKEIFRSISLLNLRLPGLLPRVECIPALMACMVMDKAPHKSQKWIYKIKTLLIEQFIVSNLTFNVSQIHLVDLIVTFSWSGSNVKCYIHNSIIFFDQLSVIFRSIHK